DAVEVSERPAHGVSVGDAFDGLGPDHARALLDWAEETDTVLYDSLAASAQNALARAGEDRQLAPRLRSTGRGLGLGMGLRPPHRTAAENARSTTTSPSAKCDAATA